VLGTANVSFVWICFTSVIIGFAKKNNKLTRNNNSRITVNAVFSFNNIVVHYEK